MPAPTTNTDDDPYTPVSPRVRRLSIRKSGHVRQTSANAGGAPPSFLRPPTDFNPRSRSTSMPSHMTAKAAVSARSRIPKPPARDPMRPSGSRLPVPSRPLTASPKPISPTLPPPDPRTPPSRIPSSISTSYCEQLRQRPRFLVKPDPHILMRHLHDYIGRDFRAVAHYLSLDDLVALHERELMEREVRGSRRKNSVEEMPNVFGAPLRQVSAHASTTAVLGGLEHELPIVVYSCVEELYRALKAPPSPARSSSSRVAQLVLLFDTPPHFGCTTSLYRESESDVFATLHSFLSRLPEPVVYPQGIVNALTFFCLDDIRQNIGSVQRLLRFLPSANLSLFVYLLAFLSQVNQTKPGIEVDLGQAFGRWVFGSLQGPQLLVWFIKNWIGIVRGLFDLDWDVAVNHSSEAMNMPDPRLDNGELLLPSPYDRREGESLAPMPPGPKTPPADEDVKSLFTPTVALVEPRLLDEPLPNSCLGLEDIASPPLLRVVNPNAGSQASSASDYSTSNSPTSETESFARLDFASHSSQFVDLEKRLKISNALKDVPEAKDGVSIISREAVVHSDSDTDTSESEGEGCGVNCPMRARVAMLEGYLTQVLQERDDARQVVDEIRELMQS